MTCAKKVWVFPGTKVHPEAACKECNGLLTDHTRVENFACRPGYAFVTHDEKPTFIRHRG